MPVFATDAFDDHERVVFCRDLHSGLRAIIAIHSTALGPAAGGCRMREYQSEAEALRDVLRLSRGMSFKNAMADLPLGGGKSVILGDPRRNKTESLLQAFARSVDQLGGSYITAEDVGMSVTDMEIIARHTRYVSGLPKRGNAAGGDPSTKTAYGVYLGILASVAFRTGEANRKDLKGIRVAVQGLGAVGYNLCLLLAKAGAKLLIADVDDERVKRACRDLDVAAVPVPEVIYEDADVFAPCALGGILNDQTIPDLNVSIVAGAANNQLATDVDGIRLRDRDILYAPDFVINAGGIISVAYEYLNLGGEDAVLGAIEQIGQRLTEIFKRASETGRAPSQVADELAREKLSMAAQARSFRSNAA